MSTSHYTTKVPYSTSLTLTEKSYIQINLHISIQYYFNKKIYDKDTKSPPIKPFIKSTNRARKYFCHCEPAFSNNINYKGKQQHNIAHQKRIHPQYF